MDFNMTKPYPESYWVIPGLFMAGEHPGGWDELETRRRIQALLRCGLLNFIDLTDPDDTGSKYAKILEDEANGYLKTITYLNFPIPDRSILSTEGMCEILDALDQRINARSPVYVHCMAGIGRTGTVVGCYLVRHGAEPGSLLRQIERLRGTVPSRWVRSPESDAQVDFILNWKNGQ